MSKIRKRYDYLDIAKAIAIFLVIIGHAAPNTDDPFYRVVIYSFHMPLFFMVSGVFVRRHKITNYGLQHWKDFLLKNVLAIVVPYFIWALIYCTFSFPNVGNILYGSWEALGKASTHTSLWYLTCLFCARILMELVLMVSYLFKKINRHVFSFGFAIISFAIGMLLPKLPGIGYPWCFNIAFIALGFMLIGYSVKDFILSLQQKSLLSLILCFIASVGIFAASIAIQVRMGEFKLVLMCGNELGNPVFFFINSLSGSASVLFLSVIIAKLWENNDGKIKRATLWIGKNTIGILLVHKQFLQAFPVAFMEKFGWTPSSVAQFVKTYGYEPANVPPLFVAFLGAVVALLFSVLIIKIVEKFIPQVFGKFPTPKRMIVNESLEPESVDEANALEATK